MRTFIAIEIPEHIQKKTFLLTEKIPPTYVRIKWVKQFNIHLTLLFLGDVDETNMEMIKEGCLSVSSSYFGFDMALLNSGVFPNFRKPRIIWVGISPDSKTNLVHLANLLREALSFLKIDERKGFSPHITLGRIKNIYNLLSLKDSIEQISFKTEKFPVKEITIFKSVLKPDGPIYTPMAKFPLRL